MTKSKDPNNKSTRAASNAEGTNMETRLIREEINQIKAENLSGQQLRMARKLAQKHDLEASSDLDAVRLLRNIGIDPFGSGTVSNESKAIPLGQMESGVAPSTNLPAKRVGTEVGAKAPLNESDRARAVLKIQRDLMRRRRRRMIQLATRLFFFIGIPTLFSAIYFYGYATPMYAAKSEFVVQSASNPASPTGDTGLLGGGGLFGDKDPVGVQGYLTSIEAMLQLDQDHDFRTAFQSEDIDPIQRLEPDASNEKAFKRYKKAVVIGFDQTEGVIRMEVITPDPKLSVTYTKALIEYAEDRLVKQTSRLRKDQMKGARELYNEAELNLKTAQDKVVDLQEQAGILNAEAEFTVQLSKISELESVLLNRKLTLAELEANTRPNQAKVQATKNQINEIEKTVQSLRNDMVQASSNDQSLARLTGQLAQAQADVLLRQNLLAKSVGLLEASTIEASRQTKYLALNVNPIEPQEAAYPKKFENTILAFLVFAGLYLMISLTGSILREQVSN